jgi:hypothetical protein
MLALHSARESAVEAGKMPASLLRKVNWDSSNVSYLWTKSFKKASRLKEKARDNERKRIKEAWRVDRTEEGLFVETSSTGIAKGGNKQNKESYPGF